MKKIAWCTDVHFDVYSNDVAREYGQLLAKKNYDAILLTGDITQSQYIQKHLTELCAGFGKQVYFVTGNHDLWGSSCAEVENVCSKFDGYLHGRSVQLSPTTWLVGSNGWYDCTLGKPKESMFIMNDWLRIQDIMHHYYTGNVISPCQQLATASVEALKRALNKIPQAERIIVATHVPPFAENARHRGQMSDPHSLPWYTNYRMGQFLLSFAKQNPNVSVEVYCGHSHSKAEYSPLPNLVCRTGVAEYGIPQISGDILVD